MAHKRYKIGELAGLLKVTQRTIRFWEQAGLLAGVRRTEGGMRLYDDRDLAVLKKIQHFKSQYLPLRVIKDRLRQELPGYVEPRKARVKIVLDSTAALPPELIKRYDLRIIPLLIHFGRRAYRDGIDMTPADFYDRLKKAGAPPTTGSVSVEELVKIYERLAADGATGVLAIHLSRTFSSMAERARQAAKIVRKKIQVEVVDSKSAGMGLGFLAAEAAEMLAAGRSLAEVRDRIEQLVPEIGAIITCNTPAYLSKGGHSGVSDEILRLMLKYKPIMAVWHGTGRLELLDLVPDKAKAVERIADLVTFQLRDRRTIRGLAVSYSYLYAEAMELINRLKKRFPEVEVVSGEGSAILGAHLGPESLGVVYY